MKRRSEFSRPVLIIAIMLLISGLMSAQITPEYYNNTGGPSSNAFPLNSSTNKVQWIYGPGVFNTAGLTGTPAPAGLISKVYFTIGTTTSGTAVYSNFTIKLSQNVGTITAWTDPLFVTGMTTVFAAATHSLVNPVTDGWQEITLQTPFFYDPSLSLVFELSVTAGTGNSVRQQSTVGHGRRYGNVTATSGTTGVYLINFGFELAPAGTDAGLQEFANLPDTMCEGLQPVEVILKNHGPNVLASVDIEWKVNNVAQPTFNWSGNLAANDTTLVTIGQYPFIQGINHAVQAYTVNPNGLTDTFNLNDTIIKPEIVISPSPNIVLNDTLITVCVDDPVTISGTLSGTPPWDVMINDGVIGINVLSINNPAFSYSLTASTTKTYTFSSIKDATGCETINGPSVTVTVQPLPPAVITPLGSLAACEGDSVTLMASIGLDFSYQWIRNNVNLPGDTTYVLHAKTGGDYSVKVTSPIGCENISTPVTVIIHPLPVVSLGKDTVLLPGQNIILNAGSGFNSYLWSTGATTQSILVDSAGVGIGVKTIWVHVTDNYYCLGGDTININFTNHPGIDESFPNADIKIIPNPSDGRIELQFAGMPAGQYDIEIFSPDGKAVYRSKHQLNNDKIKLDLSHIADGVYLLKVSGTAGTVVERIVIRN